MRVGAIFVLGETEDQHLELHRYMEYDHLLYYSFSVGDIQLHMQNGVESMQYWISIGAQVQMTIV